LGGEGYVVVGSGASAMTSKSLLEMASSDSPPPLAPGTFTTPAKNETLVVVVFFIEIIIVDEFGTTKTSTSRYRSLRI
jgi:hypothetical protein